ncbi:zinc ABC transporter substrate-binding protein [Candidatus Saccharibacteria bacterium]|nr:zinc ABC transporter substrate-binding protein [Candidatus Saccharibacteria bacterium]
MSTKLKFAKITIIIAMVAALAVLSLVFLNAKPSKYSSAKIISTNFIGYDFARAVVGNSSNLAMLIAPGTDIHSFEPTPEDIIAIQNAELFIYVGGESDSWVDNLLATNEIPADKTLRLMSLVELKTEELVEGMQPDAHETTEHTHHHGEDSHEESSAEAPEYDEHIWTSPVNAIKLVSNLADRLSSLHPENQTFYAENATAYNTRLRTVDAEIRQIVATSQSRLLIFADRFPFRYFVDEYGLSYYAAFPGCAEQTEASSQTIAFLIDKVKSTDTQVIFKTELSSDKLASAISAETGAKILELNAAHNISSSDFSNGLTYASIMESNVKVLKEALN